MKYSYILYDSIIKCDQILENSSKSYMKYAVFLCVFNAISVNVYVFLEHFLNNFRNFSYTNSTQYQEISCNNAIRVHGSDKYMHL